MSLRPRIAAAIATTMVLATFAPAPALAQATGTGSIAFSCTAHLPEWASPNGAGDCRSDVLPAMASVSLSGITHMGTPYTVDGIGGFHATFTYSNSCILNEPPLLGFAQGTAIIENAPAVHVVPTTADLRVAFQWTRIGATAVVTTSRAWIAFANGGTAETLSGGAGTAAFVPILPTGPWCPSGGPLKAQVSGTVAYPG